MRVSEYIELFKNHNRRETGFFQHRSWQVVEKLERFLGIWPYQSRFKNYFMRTFVVSLMISAMIPIAVRLRKEWGVNLGIATENVTGVLTILAGLIKLFLLLLNNRKRRKIYEKVNDQFRTITDPQEAFILSRSAEHGMRFCIKYIATYFTAEAIFFLLPTAKMVYEYFIIDGQLEKTLPYYADYGFIDEDKYYVPIMLQIIVTATFFITAHCANDFGFIMNVRHVCALFKIVKIRLREASGFLEEYEWDMLDFITSNNKASELITRAIDLHNEALEMVPLINEAYSFGWFSILLANALIFSAGVYLVLVNSDHPFNLLRYLTFFVALCVHFFVIFAHGQMIIDSSSSVFDACYNVKWYLASTKTRKLLLTAMSRSSRPCELTGGGIFVISMETCGKMAKGGYSYFSVFTRK